jgi:tetratricopeptide (TPR) repeat protein
MKRHSLVMWLGLLAAGCGSTPLSLPDEAPLRKQALATEQDAAKRFARGDHVGAKLTFAEAARLYQSIDDLAATERNQAHAARAELALGQAEAALRRMADLIEANSIEALSVVAQAQLSLGKTALAQVALTRALSACPATCEEHSSLRLLQARLLLAEHKPAEAAPVVEAVLKMLNGKDELREIANAWRLLASARLALEETAAAQAAAQEALTRDRQLGLPEKIARDWMLLGAIRAKAGSDDAASAYRRALAVARAAGLADIIRQAENELPKTKGSAK